MTDQNKFEANSAHDEEEANNRRLRQKRIGNQLRRLYEDVATEPIPDDFMKLLEEADKKKKS